MMQPEILESPWPYLEGLDEPYDFSSVLDHVDDCGFSAIFNGPQDNNNTCSEVLCSSAMFTNDHIPYTIDEETMQLPPLMDDFSMELDGFGPEYPLESSSEGSFFPSQQNLCSEVGIEYSWSPTPSMNSELSTSPIQQQPSLNFFLPQENKETDNRSILGHLLEALREALEQRQKALAEEILRCMSHKASTPLGESLERLLFYMSRKVTNPHGGYLEGEALKSSEDAFRALYQGIPDGRVAHLAATSAILEAVPEDCEAVHVVDCYMGLGAQWVPLIEAMADTNRTLKLTSIKWDYESPESTSPWNFERTQGKLCEHAKSCGLKLKVEEKGVDEVAAEIKRINKRGGRNLKEFLSINCMLGLPHMGRVRSRRQEAMDFLRLAMDLIKDSGNKGIVTFGDGNAFDRLKKNCLNFRQFFDEHLMHYHALLDSVESNFPKRFSEARTAMECLFVAPYISAFGWLQKWEEMKRDCHIQDEIGLEGCRLSNNVLMEAKEMLRGSEGSYQARIEGQNGNELVLEWKGTELMRVSAWRN